MTAPRPIPPVLGTSPAPLTDEDLDAIEAVAQGADQYPEAVQRFRVNDDGAAEWCMRHVRRIDADLAAAKAQADEWRAEIDAWLDSRQRPLQASRSFFAHHLAQYAIATREANPKIKTLTLPSGNVATTEKKPVVDLVDGSDEQVVAWRRDTFPAEVLEAMEPIKVTEKVLKTGLRKLVVIWQLVARFDDDGAEVEDSRRWMPMLDDNGKPVKLGPGEQVIRRGAVPPVNPATGEAWSDDVPVEDRIAPHIYVTSRSIEATVKPNPVQS